MKYLRLVFSLSLVAFLATFSIASADSCSCGCSSSCLSCSTTPVTLTITKATGKAAKIMLGSKVACAPISFGDGASWDSVKDSYSVAPCTASAIEAGKIAISISSDGTATFNKKK